MKNILFAVLLISTVSFAQRKKEVKPSTDTIYFSVEKIQRLFTKKVGDTLESDKVVFVGNKPFGKVVQFKWKKYKNALATFTRFNNGSFSAMIIKDTLFYEWQDGYFLKKRSPIVNNNGENFFKTVTYTPLLTDREADSILLVHGGVCCFFDFDGQTVTGTVWNDTNPVLVLGPSIHNSNPASMDSIVNLAKEMVSGLPIVVTRDSTLYFLASITRRTRVIYTVDWAWWVTGGVTGVSFQSSLYRSDEQPSFVFDRFVGAQDKATTGLHEFGHTMGLYHMATPAPAGSGETGIKNVMYPATGSVKNISSWAYSTNERFELLNELDVIVDGIFNSDPYIPGIGARPGDQGTTIGSARILPKDKPVNALITTNDSDYYKIVIPSAQTIVITATPKNLGSSNFGATLDIALDLYDGNGNFITSGFNSSVLNASISQAVGAGTYYVKVRGDRSNPNLTVRTNNGKMFMGHYTISYTF